MDRDLHCARKSFTNLIRGEQQSLAVFRPRLVKLALLGIRVIVLKLVLLEPSLLFVFSASMPGPQAVFMTEPALPSRLTQAINKRIELGIVELPD
jgi:hypothetical protein